MAFSPKHALQDISGGQLIDGFGPFGAAAVGLNHIAGYGRR